MSVPARSSRASTSFQYRATDCFSLGVDVKVNLAPCCIYIYFYRESLRKYTRRCSNDFNVQGYSSRSLVVGAHSGSGSGSGLGAGAIAVAAATPKPPIIMPSRGPWSHLFACRSFSSGVFHSYKEQSGLLQEDESKAHHWPIIGSNRNFQSKCWAKSCKFRYG